MYLVVNQIFLNYVNDKIKDRMWIYKSKVNYIQNKIKLIVVTFSSFKNK